jgi:hypothetical protein
MAWVSVYILISIADCRHIICHLERYELCIRVRSKVIAPSYNVQPRHTLTVHAEL